MSHDDNSGLSPVVMKSSRYGAISQAFHWIMAVVILVAFIYGPGGSEQRVYSAARDFDRQLHETLGMTVFALAFARLLWRAAARPPDPPQIAFWLDFGSRLVQVLLYLLFFLLPLTAIAGAWLEGHALTLLGGAEIAPWIGENRALGARIARIHTWLGDAMMWIAGAHALAAIFHHIVLKDGVLVSMLPRWIPLRAPRGK